MEFWLASFVVSVIVAFGSGITVAAVFKYHVKTNQEKIFESNVDSTVKIMFQCIANVYIHRESILKILGKNKFSEDMHSLILPEHDYAEVFRRRRMVIGQIKLMPQAQKLLSFVTLDQYLIVMKYMYSSIGFFSGMIDAKDEISINKIDLEFHRYYAKETIRLFGKKTPKWFKEKWQAEFREFGGINSIREPSPRPGDAVTPHILMDYNIMLRDIGSIK